MVAGLWNEDTHAADANSYAWTLTAESNMCMYVCVYMCMYVYYIGMKIHTLQKQIAMRGLSLLKVTCVCMYVYICVCMCTILE